MMTKRIALRFALIIALFVPAAFASVQVGGAGGSKEYKSYVVPVESVVYTMSDLLVDEKAPIKEVVKNTEKKTRKTADNSKAIIRKEELIQE